MKRTGIRGWLDVVQAACPPGRPPTPTIPRSAPPAGRRRAATGPGEAVVR